jgi:hypothetical protein
MSLEKENFRKTSIQCNTCKKSTNHEILSENVIGKNEPAFGSNNEYIDTYYFATTAQILKCMGCDSISFREEITVDGDDTLIAPKVFPKRSLNSVEIKKYPNIDPRVTLIYTQTIETYNNGQSLLCAAGIRGIVEAICRVKRIKDGPVKKSGANINRSNQLVGKINGLQEKGIITNIQASILHATRYLGNEAIHEIREPSKDDLKKGIDVIEHIITAIFVLPKMANKLHKRSGSHF